MTCAGEMKHRYSVAKKSVTYIAIQVNVTHTRKTDVLFDTMLLWHFIKHYGLCKCMVVCLHSAYSR